MQAQPLSTKFHLVREHRLHGVVTGLQAVKIISSLEDHLDRLLVSFKDAKVGACDIGVNGGLTDFVDRPPGMVNSYARPTDRLHPHIRACYSDGKELACRRHEQGR